MDNIKRYVAGDDLLQDRVILVTGAGQGIGRVAALNYAACGATVILHGRNVEKLEQVYDEIEALNKAHAIIYQFDLESAEDDVFQSVAEGIAQQLGRLDGILHNAAFLYELSPLEHQTLNQWQVMLQVNLMAPFALTRACLPLLKAAPDSSVVMTSSTSGHQPTAYWGGFAVAKAGVEALVKIQAEEWEAFPNMRINTLIPGVVNSPQRAKTHPGEEKSSLIQAEEIMPSYLYLMSPDSKGTNGQVILC